MTQQPLFQLPACPACRGAGRTLNHDLGWHDTCARCGGTGIEPIACRICGQPANGLGSYCDRHDPDTAPIPYT